MAKAKAGAKARTLTIRFDEHDSEMLDDFQKRYGVKTASKALRMAMIECMLFEDQLIEAKGTITKLTEDRSALATVIDNARNSATAFLDQVGQEDMLLGRQASDV